MHAMWRFCCRCERCCLLPPTAGVMAAFRAIGDTFLIVFIGIFLALVFEYPVRLVMAKTRHVARSGRDRDGARHCPRRARGRAAVPGAARRRGARLPPGASADGRTAARIGRALWMVRRQRRRRERAVRGREGLVGGAGRDLGRARHRGRLLLRLPRQLHDHLHLPVPAHGRREPETGAGERADARGGRALAGSLGARDDRDLALGDRCRRHRHDRRNHPRAHGLAARFELRPRAWR